MTDPTPLEMIYNSLERMEQKQDIINQCMVNIKLDGQQREGRLKAVELDGEITKQIILKHLENKEKHFNPYFNETYTEKMKRKKAEIGTSVTIGSVIFGIILAAGKYFGVI